MLNPKNFALSGGIIWGGSLFLLTLISVATGYGEEFLNIVGSAYPGHDISWQGSLWGLFLGFVDGFVALYLLALLYNWINKKKKKNKEENKDKQGNEEEKNNRSNKK